jgi:hypothetical protein
VKVAERADQAAVECEGVHGAILARPFLSWESSPLGSDSLFTEPWVIGRGNFTASIADPQHPRER